MHLTMGKLSCISVDKAVMDSKVLLPLCETDALNYFDITLKAALHVCVLIPTKNSFLFMNIDLFCFQGAGALK